jgi:isoleucyl-tRNA synthetase
MSFTSEKDVNHHWQQNNIVSKVDEQNKDGPKFNFYDGPPFASGNPHFGHLLTSTIKDTVVRYWLMNGHNVRRVWGWDTHGVPIESKTNIELNIKCKEDVHKMGIGEYNKACRKYVMSCQDKWETVISKMGRWVNMKDSYKTMDIEFMNTVWYMFKQLSNKDLVYNGVKIMSYSPELESPLSNNEANQNYKKVKDPSLTIIFPAEFNNDFIGNGYHTSCIVNILVWTTTPWTLPCNLLLCVHPDLEYSFVLYDDKIYLLLTTRIKIYFKDKYKIINTILGNFLYGIKYVPLFDFYKDFKPAKIDAFQFTIVIDKMVSSDTGTGIVHIAPGFGQEDKDVSDRYELTSDTVLPPCPLDDKCYYTEPVASMDMFKDRFCKDCDKDVIKYLDAIGRVFKKESITHDYPYCYRTGCPLIYRTYPAWFIKVKEHKEKIKSNLMKTNWVPTYVRDNKYMQALDSCVDWCFSRNRFWGTPLPIWTNGSETIVIGSATELEELANLEKGSIVDLHPEYIWPITIPSSKPGGKPLENVKLVFDCWFESGSMPFGQWGYPYNDKVKLDDIFPADFIAEGTDQTRGWFHAMMTLYTLVLDRPPFKNVIVNGIVQSKVEGTKDQWAKMSKKDGNYEDPEDIIDKYGADTLRLFLIKSPGVRGGDVPFDTSTLGDIYNNYHIMIQNMVQFWKQSIDIYEMMYNETVSIVKLDDIQDKFTLIDIWIIQELDNYVTKMSTEYQEFKLYYLVDHVSRFIDKISKWYIKLNKKSLKGENGKESFTVTINVFAHVLYYLTLLMAPITPFLSESCYLNMKQHLKTENHLFKLESIHLHRITKPELKISDVDGLMDAMDLFIKSLTLTRQCRYENKKPLKMPLTNVIIAYDNPNTLNQLSKLGMYMKQEINSFQIVFEHDPLKYIIPKYKSNKKIIGQTYKKDAKSINKYLESLDIGCQNLEDNKTIDYVCPSGTEVQLDKSYFSEYMEINSDIITPTNSILYDGKFVMIFDLETNEDITNTYYINCVVREIQQMRKETNLKPADTIVISYISNEKTDTLMNTEKYKTYLDDCLHQSIIKFDDTIKNPILYTTERDIADEYKLTINFHKDTTTF